MRVIGVLGTVVVAASGCSFHVAALSDPNAPAQPEDMAHAVSSSGDDLAMAPTGQPDLARRPAIDLAMLPPGQLRLTTTPVAAPSDVDLTADGSSDWMSWGFAAASDTDHDANGGGQIGYSIIGKNKISRYDDNVLGYLWSNGAPPRVSSGGSKHVGVYVIQPGNGFQITLPAGTQPRSATLYLGGFHAQSHFEASLSDDSAAPVSDDSLANPSGKFDGTFKLDYRARSDGQTLTVRWTETSGDAQGNVTLQAVTLR